MKLRSLLKTTTHGRSIDIGLLLVRLLFGLSLVINHGWPTFKGFLNGVRDFPDPLGIGPGLSICLVSFSEFICAVLVSAGLFTRFAAIPVLIGFVVAFFVFHGNDPFNVREKAFLYGASFLIIAVTGPGTYSLDNCLFKSPL